MSHILDTTGNYIWEFKDKLKQVSKDSAREDKKRKTQEYVCDPSGVPEGGACLFDASQHWF